MRWGISSTHMRDDDGLSHVEAIPRISTPMASRTGSGAVLLNSEAMAVGGPSPGAHHACFFPRIFQLLQNVARTCWYPRTFS